MTVALRLIVATPGQISRAADALSGHAAEWSYFGTNLSQRAKVAAALPGVPWRPVGEHLTRVAAAAKQPFLDWIDEIGRQQDHAASWWASALASSSPLQTDFFLLFCYTRLVQEWLLAQTPGPLRLVIVGDPWLAETLRRQLSGHSGVRYFGSTLAARLRETLAWLSRIPRVMAGTLIKSCGCMLAAKRLFRASVDDDEAVLIYTWIRPECFSTSGTLTDGWTGRLKELLSSQGHCVKRLTPASILPPLLRRLQPYADECFVTPRYLTWLGLVRAVCGWFRVKGLRRLARCGGLDYRVLLRRELLHERAQADFGHYRLEYAAMCELARRQGHRVRLIIYSFENQPWEKLLCLAWRAHAPHVRLVGYQHSWVPSLLLPYSLATGQSRRAPLPDVIVANSAFNLACLAEGGYPTPMLVNGGALRYEYLHAASWGAAGNGHAPSESRAAKQVLVTLPIARSHAGSLLADLLAEFRAPLLVGHEPVRFVLKCHPSLRLDQPPHGPVALPPWMSWSQAPLGQLLPATDLLVYVGPTSSWWEARLHGVPVLKYLTDFMDMDAGASVDGMVVHTCAHGTLRPSIEALLRDPPLRRPSERRLVEHMFGRVNEQVWADLTAAARPLPCDSRAGSA